MSGNDLLDILRINVLAADNEQIFLSAYNV